MGIRLARHSRGGQKITGKRGNELVVTGDKLVNAPDPLPPRTNLVPLPDPRDKRRRGNKYNAVESSDTYDIFLAGGKGSLVPLCFFHADKRLFNSFVLFTSDCRLFIEELDRGDSAGERGLDGVNLLSMLSSLNLEKNKQ